LHPYQNSEKSFYHFSFLRDSKVHGIYYNTIAGYLSRYPFIIKDHTHDFFSILMFTKGNGTIKINNDRYTVQPQTIYLIAPNQIHSFEELSDAEGVIFFFCQDFYVEEYSFIRLLNVFSYTSQVANNYCNPCIFLSDADYKSVNIVIESVKDEYGSLTLAQNSAGIIRSYLNILLLKLTDLYQKESDSVNKTDSIIIHTLSQLVESNYIREQQVGFYSSAINISESHLNDLCNRHFNCGLKKILQNRLMQEARKLLMSSDLSVAEIGYNLNFVDNSYFNKVFKNLTGITPKRFREMHKKLLP
jgi:AraC family transcriptional regulator, transcriptional activator of pobA